MKAVPKMFIYAKKLYKIVALVLTVFVLCLAFIFAKEKYTRVSFGKAFEAKANTAALKLYSMREDFKTCAALCNADYTFMQSIVFPEVMRYNSIKDGIEAESLRTLYVQFGADYANFSIGLFQMKPTFAELVEQKSKQWLPVNIYKELQLDYNSNDEEDIRMQRLERLQDEDWQMVYLTAFICLCNKMYVNKIFSSQKEKLQWYATVYNAGFDKKENYISQKIQQDNFYLNQGMPEKKFKYAAIAGWYYNKTARP
jgi:hypothetical protein